MLDKSSLSQLKQLKQSIDEQKVRAHGTVTATLGKHGFVETDQGERIYLPPDAMQNHLPGDEVSILIEKDKNNKKFAVVEKMHNIHLTELTGRYRIKNNHHFIEPDLPNYSRWLFVPGSHRKVAQQNDYVSARIIKHPYKNQGKPQVMPTRKIGSDTDANIVKNYIIEKYRLQQSSPENWQQDTPTNDTNRTHQDLTHLNFISIDGAATRDIDDALFVEKLQSGWKLYVAIADVGEFVSPGSVLDIDAQEKGSSIYFPGTSIPMLPEALSEQHCSLIEDQQRLALTCIVNISATGNLDSYKFIEAIIKSSAKLSYYDACNIIENNKDHTTKTLLETLHDLGKTLRSNREKNLLVSEDRQEFALLLDDNGLIKHTKALTKTIAHNLVEECMIAANRCATDFLKENSALFVSHPGFRKKRIKDIKTLLLEQCQIGEDKIDPANFDGYKQTFQAFAQTESQHPLQEIAKRSLDRSTLSTAAKPHFGLQLEAYTTFTSPLRKYSDLIAHRAIKAKLHGQSFSTNSALADALNENSQHQRAAIQELDQRLKCIYLQSLDSKTLSGKVNHIHSRGMSIQLLDSGIEGQLLTKDIGGKFSFDTVYMRLSNAEQEFQLNQIVSVTLVEADPDKRVIRFKLAKINNEEVLTDNNLSSNSQAIRQTSDA